ncbi:phage holin family protein [Austwickia chelonae]|uniref:phage holin family protein n=1 Tax=Austwickia chelonae TaxID=100225 RepID=UPI000E2500B4|nr:phage holin family protein [Austwickia chelonae]
MSFIARTLAVAAATAVAAWIVPGITLTGSGAGGKALTLILVALIIGLINAVVKPVVEFLTGCLVVVSLGLFLLVINAFMLLLSSWVAQHLALGFHVRGFWAAFFGSIVISAVSGLITWLFVRD